MTRSKIGIGGLMLCCALPCSALARAEQTILTVDLAPLHSDRGRVVVALFNGAGGFPKKPGQACRRAATVIKRGNAKVRFRQLRPGTYAVSVFHDENNNGKLDRDWIGRPKEGIGASNDAKGSWGPPKFKDAKFKLASTKTIRIRIRYQRSSR
jgi:uncharacterized protein (DUF2141 family)